MSNRFSNKNTPTNFSASSAETTLNDIAFNDENQYFVYLSSDVGNSTNENRIDDANQILQNTVFVSRILPSDVSLVARRVEWNRGDVFWRWSSAGQGVGERNTYALNKTNNIIYLCVRGPNSFWRKDREGRSAVTSVPDSSVTKEYNDGSIWKPLCKIDQSKDFKFGGTYLPFSDPETETSFSLVSPGISKYSSYNQQCPKGANETGTCCLYLKKGYYDEVAGISYSAGDFYHCECTKCYKCIDLSNKTNMDYRFTHHGITGSTADSCIGCDQESFPTDCGNCACNIEPRNFQNVLEESFQSTGVFHNAGFMHKLISNDIGGEIISMFIDLSGLSKQQLLLSGNDTSAWNLNITSSTGNDAEWKVVGYTEDGGKTYYASGLHKISGGSDYLDASVVNLNDIFTNGLDPSRLEINITPISGIIYNLKEIFQDVKLQIVKIFRTNDIKNTIGTDVVSFDRAGIRKNITVADGYRTLGYGSNSNLPIDIRTTAKITAVPNTVLTTSSNASSFQITSKGKLSSNLNMKNIKNNSDGSKTLEFSTSDITSLKDITTLEDTTNNITYTITDKNIQTDPVNNEDINLSTGSILSTKEINLVVPEDYQPEKSFVIRITLGNITNS